MRRIRPPGYDPRRIEVGVILLIEPERRSSANPGIHVRLVSAMQPHHSEVQRVRGRPRALGVVARMFIQAEDGPVGREPKAAHATERGSGTGPLAIGQ